MLGMGKIPSSKSVSEASALLNVLGGGSKEVKQLLKEINKEVENHQTAAREAKTAKKEADETIAELSAADAESRTLLENLGNQRDIFRREMIEKNTALDKRENTVSNSEKVVEGKYRDFTREKLEVNKVVAKQKNAIDQRIVQLDKRETKITERETKLRQVVSALRPLSDALAKVLQNARDI